MACYEADADGGTDFLKGELSIDVVQVKRNIGECHFNVRQYDAAIKAFVDALNYQRDARRKHDAVNDDDLDDSVGEEKSFLAHMYMMISDESIADTIRRLGKAFAARGLFKEALGIYREAEQIHRSAINEATAMSRGREVPDKQDLLAHTLYCIAEVHTSAKDYDSAMKLFHESMQLRMIADGHRPETRRCNMIHCAMCVVGIANVHYQKEEFSNALKHYIDALHFCEAQGKIPNFWKSSCRACFCFVDLSTFFFSFLGIPNTNAIVKMIDQKRTDTEKMILENPTRTLQMSQLESQAESHRERRNYDKAIACLGKALALRQANVESIKAAKLDPTKEIAATVKLLNKFGQIFEEQGDEQKAKKAHLDAVRLYRKIAGKVQLCN
jgi:tetratricopeptide (TPR) repeat protein